MNHTFLRSIDAAIIDEIFQPACNWLNRVFGCTSRIPVAVGYFFSVIGVLALVHTGLSLGGVVCNLLALFMGAYCFVRSIVVYHLVMDELNADDSSNVPESKRFTGFKDRVVTLLLTVVTLGPVVILFLIVFKDDVSAIAYAVGSIGNLCAAYFDACTSPPKKRRMAMRSLSSQNQ